MNKNLKKALAIGFLVVIAVYTIMFIIYPLTAKMNYKRKAMSILKNTKTTEDRDTAVGDLGVNITLEDNSWITIMYNDSHAIPAWSIAVAHDSKGRWYTSGKHHCGRFQVYKHNLDIYRKSIENTPAEKVERSMALVMEDNELYELVFANSLEDARRKLLSIGFKKI